jgi:hypothetical protein
MYEQAEYCDYKNETPFDNPLRNSLHFGQADQTRITECCTFVLWTIIN